MQLNREHVAIIVFFKTDICVDIQSLEKIQFIKINEKVCKVR